MEYNKIKRITILMVLTTLYATYAYGEVDLNSRLWELAKTVKFRRAVNFKDENANIYNEEGLTPLMVAAQHNNSMFIGCMKQGKADVHMKDYNGKTAFDHIKKPKTKREEIFSVSIYNALRQLEVYQIIGDKALIRQEEINLKKGFYRLSNEKVY